MRKAIPLTTEDEHFLNNQALPQAQNDSQFAQRPAGAQRREAVLIRDRVADSFA